MQNRLKRLQSRIPVSRMNLQHISSEDLERLEGHILATCELRRRTGKVQTFPSVLRDVLESHEGPLKRIPLREVRRICKPPLGSTSGTARLLKDLENDALALLPAPPGRNQSQFERRISRL